MKIQLIDRDGNDFLEPAAIRQDGEVVFAANDTGRDVEVRDSRLIPETDFERLFLSHFGDNHFNVTDSYRTIVFPGDHVGLTARFANDLTLPISKARGFHARFQVINNFRNQPTPIAHSCPNCEYFLRLGQTKICNGLQVPSEDPNQPTECGHWQEINQEERSRRDRELRRQVRDVEDVEPRLQEVRDFQGRVVGRLPMFSNEQGVTHWTALPSDYPDNFPLPHRIDRVSDRACIHLNNLQRQIFLSGCLPPELLRDDKRPIANDQDQ